MRSAAAVRRSGSSRRQVVGTFVLGTLSWLALGHAPVLAQNAQKPPPERTWQGTWNNRKAGTSGPLRCTATIKDEKTWDAKFEGLFMTRRFSYDATIGANKKSGRMILEGTATIDGDSYTWSGYVSGKALFGQFRSASGNRGEFRLQEAKN